MALVDDAVRAAALAAGWKMPEPGADGTWRFHLQGDLDVMLFSPDGRSCVMAGEVRVLPAEGPERSGILAEAARRQVGACRVRPSVLAVEAADWTPSAGADNSPDDRLMLYRRVGLEAGSEREFAGQLRDFLNDLAWWRAAGAEPAFSPSGPMPGMGGIWMGGLR